MATYAIGDIQGCFASLQKLLEAIRFDAARDRLWLCGDLVNRGPRSLEVLRWARELHGSDRLVSVLGNHETTLLATAMGACPERKSALLEEVLAAPDAAELLAWVRERPLVVRDGAWFLVHAGLLPAWTFEQAEARARSAERLLRGGDAAALLRAVHEDAHLEADHPLREPTETIAVLTRIRVCSSDGRFASGFTGPPEDLPDSHAAWYELASPRPHSPTILFGHWASLGVRSAPGWTSLDSGCVWGGRLSALRLDDGEVFQVEPVADEVREHKPKAL